MLVFPVKKSNYFNVAYNTYIGSTTHKLLIYII